MRWSPGFRTENPIATPRFAEENAGFSASAAPGAAVDVVAFQIDADLASLLVAWADLAPQFKAAIMAMVAAAR